MTTRKALRRGQAATRGLLLAALAACACASAQTSPLLQSYDTWYSAWLTALASEGVITAAQAEAAAQTPAGRPDRASAAQALEAGNAAQATDALKRQAESDMRRFEAMRTRAARDRDWVLAELQRLGVQVPEALAGRKYITSRERDDFSLGLPVQWALAPTAAEPPAAWTPPEAPATAAVIAVPYDPGGLAEFYAAVGTGPRPSSAPLNMPYDPAELWAFYSAWSQGDRSPDGG